MIWKVMRRNVWNDIKSWQTRWLNNSTKYYSMDRWPSLQRGRIEICRWIGQNMLSNCSEMLVLGTNYKTWYPMVSEQTCTIHNKMDQSMWQTPESLDFIYSSHEWIQTILSCGKYCYAMQIGTVSGLWLCGRSWRFKIYIRWNIVRFWKSYICSNKLDVQETNLSFTQFDRIRNHLFGCRIEIRRYSRSLDLCDLIVVVPGNTTQNHDRTVQPVVCRDTNHERQQSRGVINVLDNVDLVPSSVQFSNQEALLYVFEDNEAVIKMIMKGKKSHNETCFQNAQSCSGLVVRSN